MFKDFWSKFNVTAGSNMLENALLGLVSMKIIVITKVSALMQYRTRMNALVSGVKRSKVRVTV